jgi:hypothetical protein
LSQPQRRTKLEDFAEYQKAFAKENELKAAISVNEERISWLYAETARRGERGYKEQNVFQRALQKLGNVATPEQIDTATIEKELRDRLAERPVLRKALDLAAGEVAKATAIASRQICTELAPAYSDIARKVVGAAVALSQANQEAKRFLDQLDGLTSVSSFLRPIWFCDGYIGSISDAGSGVARLVKEAKEAGLVSTSLVEKIFGVK